MKTLDRPSSRGVGLIAAVAAVMVGFVSIAVLASWAIGAETPTRLIRRAPAMVPNTALGLLLAAVGLWFARRHADAAGKTGNAIGKVASSIVLAIGALTTLEYVIGVDLRIDRILDVATRTAESPRRPSPQTGVALTLLGMSLLSVLSRNRGRGRTAQVFAATGTVIGALALTGYAFDARGFYGTPDFLPYTGMAVHTAAGILLLGIGLLALRPDLEIMRLPTSPGAGGKMLRILLPFAVAAPFTINFLALRGAEAGYFTSSYALALAAIAAITVLLLVVWLTAAATERADGRRASIENALRRSRKTYRDAYLREQEATKQLRELDEMKNSFLRAVSHELRTPLTAVIGFSETLIRPEVGLSEEQLDFATRISSNARRLDILFTDLLDLDRLSRGIFTPRRRPVDMAPLIDSVAKVIDLDNRPIDIQIDESGAVAFLDPGQVGRILENLLSNAVRHTPAGTPISVHVYASDDGATLTVDDRGPGVPDTIRETIFQPFTRGPNTTFVAGVGVGLSLVRRFAELHGGRAWVEDRQGGGASFRVSLPAWPANDRPRVLLTSRPDMGSGIEHALDEAGYEVALCVGSGESPACGRCPLVATGSCPLAEGANVVVFARDLDDPENSEVLRAYRAACPRTPVIVQADAATAARHRELLAGCVVVSEQLEADHLIALIRKALGEELVSNSGV